jgi:hypothetical protein
VRLEKAQRELGITTADSDDSVTLFSDYGTLVYDIPELISRSKSGTNILELRKKLKMAFVRVLKKIEFLNADKEKWQPTLKLTYVNDRTATVDVVPFLSERTQKWIKNGIYHRKDINRRRKVE